MCSIDYTIKDSNSSSSFFFFFSPVLVPFEAIAAYCCFVWSHLGRHSAFVQWAKGSSQDASDLPMLFAADALSYSHLLVPSVNGLWLLSWRTGKCPSQASARRLARKWATMTQWTRQLLLRDAALRALPHCTYLLEGSNDVNTTPFPIS